MNLKQKIKEYKKRIKEFPRVETLELNSIGHKVIIQIDLETKTIRIKKTGNLYAEDYIEIPLSKFNDILWFLKEVNGE